MTDQRCSTSEAEGRPGKGVEGILADLLAAQDLDAELVELTTPLTELVDLHWGADLLDRIGLTSSETPDPAEGDWAGGLDPVAVRAAMSGLTGLGLPEQAAEQVLTVAVGMGISAAGTAAGRVEAAAPGSPATARDQQLIDGIQATMVLSRFADAAMLGMVRELAVAAGQELLARADVAGVDELSMTRRTQWRAQTRSAVACELQALTGWGIQSCHDRVGLALAPGGVAQRAQWALAAGWVSLRDVLDFWRRARNLPVTQAGVVADQVLGPVPDGDGVPVRPSREQFTSRLHQAVVAAEGSDAAAARARRRARLESRDATALLDDDGTATFTVTGPTSAVAAAMLRVDSVARRARHRGDERTIAQLRADLTLALLVHGILPGEEEGQDQADEPVSAPAGARQPDSGTDATTEVNHACHESTTEEPSSNPAQADPEAAAQEPAPQDHAAQDHADDATVDEEPLVAEPGPRLRGALDSDAAQVNLEVIVPWDALVDPDATAVAHVPGFGPISAEHARELAATPGTTIHRLLTDPADGRCVERSIASYRPDAAMLAQLRAADRTCRSPGCTRDVAHAQPDHVQPWAQSRWTSEANVAYEHSHHHHNLTLKLWASQLSGDRTMRFTTLFGRVYTTRSHDYRAYHPLDRPTTPTGTTLPNTSPTGTTGTTLPGTSVPEGGSPGADPPGGDPDLGNRLVYAALAHRGPRDYLADDLDEQQTCDDSALPTRAELTAGEHLGAPLFDLRHHTQGGAIRPGPPPGQPTVHDLLHPPDPDAPPPPAPPGPPPPF